MALVFGGSGVTPTLRGFPSNVVSLAAGSSIVIPSGTWNVRPGRYSTYQQYDPITQIWRPHGGDYPGSAYLRVASDGVNHRLINLTGCAVGTRLTLGGSGYTSAPTVTASAGGSTWRAIVGGLVSQTVTITNGGTNYTYPPFVAISAPPTGGVQATAICTISAGAVNAVTIVDQGAGYTSAPTMTFMNDPRDTTGANAAATLTLTGSGTIGAIVCTDHGTALTSLPTLTISGGGGSGAAASVIMCWTATAYTVSVAGSISGGIVEVSALGGYTTTAATYSNPTIQDNLIRIRKAVIQGAIASGALSATGQTIFDGGIYPGVPSGIVYAGIGTAGAQPSVAITVGGITDTVLLQPA